MTVIVVGCDGELVRIRHLPDDVRLPEAVPGNVNNRGIHRVQLQEGSVLACADQALARRESLRNRLFDLQQRLRVPRVVFDPLHVEALETPANLQEATFSALRFLTP